MPEPPVIVNARLRFNADEMHSPRYWSTASWSSPLPATTRRAVVSNTRSHAPSRTKNVYVSETSPRPRTAPLPVRAAQKSASGGEPGGHGPGAEVIASAASKVSDPVVAPVFATPEAAWTVAATASAVARRARARRRFIRLSVPVIPCRSFDEVSQLESGRLLPWRHRPRREWENTDRRRLTRATLAGRLSLP